MPDNLLTVADHVADRLDLSPAEISDVIEQANFFMSLPYEESSNGRFHSYAKKVGAPIVGFRQENQGREFSHAEYEPVDIRLEILDYSWSVDKAVAEGSPKGKNRVIARAGLDHLMAAMFLMERQFFGGQAGNAANGFQGFPDVLNTIGETVLNGGGTNVGGATSVYLVKMGQNDVCGVMPKDSNFGMGTMKIQDMTDAQGRHFPAYYTPACTWAGIQVGGLYSITRLANIDSTSAGALNDSKIYDAIEAFPMGKPDYIVMNRRARTQLRNSRTPVTKNATGTPAPIPMDVEGIPILKTEGLLNDEAIVA